MTQNRRRQKADVMKLLMSNYEVDVEGDQYTTLTVYFPGPADSPYDGGVWRVRVNIPPAYPYKSPSIGFLNRIYHPNVDETSGSVCLDVINQTWSPMFDLVNIFDVFLPQLLLYPNASDPLNGDAAALYMRSQEAYQRKVLDYVKKYALSKDPSAQQSTSPDTCASDDCDEDSLSSLESDGSDMSDDDIFG
mmetsp:Transcript_9108/g.10122  ORF Transcript_9108/g.10122 Transcript_9108/m.10122 type:complete len:191 (+) Transcript_9108:112-684(+)|eukprot:CAMPEP_0168524598 /NCGR_PEP_ID=MMETSP0405-20121227/10752_1 /TAXON_ID=498012 /ORGANISM="Trichosphaerium sp, Strain Am-I-7 wt" /LENGTH=190 /DNA_ID=CAMNT_0008546849 /DNA_START=96 /DNA_END=668 /DNA_ORIENTATION=+